MCVHKLTLLKEIQLHFFPLKDLSIVLMIPQILVWNMR